MGFSKAVMRLTYRVVVSMIPKSPETYLAREFSA